MLHLFSHEGELALAAVMRRQPLLAFDFDGTLAPIVARPGDARLSQGVAARLAMLAARLPVAIVTGRSIEDVRGRLGFEPRYIVGNHGAESGDGTDTATEPHAAMDQLRENLRAWQSALSKAGVTIEDKGQSLALHYRLSRTRERALQTIAEVLPRGDSALRVFGGKLVVDVAPAVAPDKADAVLGLVQRSGASCALFAGDDVNDEPVFARAPPHWLTLRIGRDDPQSKAQYFLDSPGEMAMLLARIMDLTGDP